MRKLVSVALTSFGIIAAVLPPAGVQASPAGTCHDPSAAPDQRVSDCTTLIDAGALSGRGLSSAHASRAAAYEAEEDFPSATKDYDEAAILDPASARALNGACRVRAMANTELRAAAQLCDRARAMASPAGERTDSRIDGNELLLLRRGQQVAALQEYDRLLSKGPQTASTLFLRGIVKRQLGDHVGADEDFANAATLDAGLPKLFKAAGIEDPRTANPVWQEKIAVARKLSALTSGFHFSSQMLPESVLEIEDYTPEVCLQSKNLANALHECRRIIMAGELSGVPLAALEARCAEIEFLLGRHAEAAHDLELATRHDPWNRSYQSNLKVVTTLAAK